MTPTKKVTLDPGESQEVAFVYTPQEAKTYHVAINGLSGSFEAILPVEEYPFTYEDLEISAPVIVGYPVTISCRVMLCIAPIGVPITHTVTLYINNTPVSSQEVTLTREFLCAETSVEFEFTPGSTRTYQVGIDGLIGSFTATTEVFVNTPLELVKSALEFPDEVREAYTRIQGDLSGPFLSGASELKEAYFTFDPTVVQPRPLEPKYIQWVSPTGFNDPNTKWGNEIYAYDDKRHTACRSLVSGESWSSYLELTHAAIYCNKVEFYANNAFGIISAISVDIYYESVWHNIYEGSFADRTWVEKAIPEGIKSITKARVKFYNSQSASRYVYLSEFKFWDVDKEPEPELCPSDFDCPEGYKCVEGICMPLIAQIPNANLNCVISLDLGGYRGMHLGASLIAVKASEYESWLNGIGFIDWGVPGRLGQGIYGLGYPITVPPSTRIVGSICGDYDCHSISSSELHRDKDTGRCLLGSGEHEFNVNGLLDLEPGSWVVLASFVMSICNAFLSPGPHGTTHMTYLPLDCRNYKIYRIGTIDF